MLTKIGLVVVAMLLTGGTALADVSIATVAVGDPGNAGELSGNGAGGYGPDRVCGAVSYEYRIGKYEVTAGQYAEFLNKVAGVDTYSLYNTNMSRTDYGSGITRSGVGTVGNPYTYSAATAFVNRPVNYVSWGDAARFANWLNNGQPTGAQDLTTTENGAYYVNGATSNAALLSVTRAANWKWALTSEDEWYKAAYYKGGSTNAGYWDYPTRSNASPWQDMTDTSGNNANYKTFPNVYPIDSGKYTTLAGEFQNSASPYGTFDQGGNVWEMDEAVIGIYRGVRGGSYIDTNQFLLASARYSYDLSLYAPELGNVGFRVVEVPEPATLSLLVLGGLGMLRRLR